MNFQKNELILEGSIGAAGSRESGGRLVYSGSLLLMNPGEFSTVMFNLMTEVSSQLDGFLFAARNVRGDILRNRLTRDETAPRFMTLVDDLCCILFVFRLARKRELILGLAIGDLVDPMINIHQIANC